MFSFFGKDAWLAYGILHQAYQGLEEASFTKSAIPVTQVRAFLEKLQDEVKKVPAEGFLTQRVVDPLTDSDGNGLISFRPAEIIELLHRK